MFMETFQPIHAGTLFYVFLKRKWWLLEICFNLICRYLLRYDTHYWGDHLAPICHFGQPCLSAYIRHIKLKAFVGMLLILKITPCILSNEIKGIFSGLFKIIKVQNHVVVIETLFIFLLIYLNFYFL